MKLNPKQQFFINIIRKTFDIKEDVSDKDIYEGVEKFQKMLKDPDKSLEIALQKFQDGPDK